MSEKLTNFVPSIRRCTQVDAVTGRIGVSFDMPDGQVMHLILDSPEAKFLAETLQDYVRLRSHTRCPCGFDGCNGVQYRPVYSASFKPCPLRADTSVDAEDGIDVLGDRIVVSGMHGGVYFPIVELNLAQLCKQGFGDQFMLVYPGQTSQLNVASGPGEDRTPQDESPEQDLNSVTGGNPGRTDRSVVEKVTVLFATGQEKLVSNIETPR